MCGIAAKLFNWRAAFIFLAIVWTIFTVLAFWTIPESRRHDLSQPFGARLKTFLKTFDAVGTVLTILGCGLLTASITLVLSLWTSLTSFSQTPKAKGVGWA